MLEVAIDTKPFDSLIAALNSWDTILREELAKACKRAGRIATRKAKEILQNDIYNVPIPAKTPRLLSDAKKAAIKADAKRLGIPGARKQLAAARKQFKATIGSGSGKRKLTKTQKLAKLAIEKSYQTKLDALENKLAGIHHITRLSIKAALYGSKAPKTTTKGEWGRWKRTENLKRQENFDYGASRDEVFVRLFNNAEYAIHRNNLGLPGHRQSGEQSGNSPTESVQWQEEAVDDERSNIEDEFSDAVDRAFEQIRKRRKRQ